MISNLLTAAGQVLSLFLMMGVGFFLVRRGRLDAAGLSKMSYILLYVVTPCVVVDALLGPRCAPELLWAILRCLGALAAAYAAYFLLCALLFRRLPADTRDPLRLAAIYSNTGFMGVPLIRGVLGEEAMIYCIVALAVFNIVTWTHGAIVMGGRENASLKKAVLNPGVLGAAAGFLLFFTGLPLPFPVASAVGYLGSLNTPLAMVVIGGQMASADLGSTFRRPVLYISAALKLIAVPFVTALLLLPFGLDGLTYQTLVILAACPTAGITGIFAQQFRRDTTAAAQSITLSTLLSILTLPVMAVFAKTLAG